MNGKFDICYCFCLFSTHLTFIQNQKTYTKPSRTINNAPNKNATLVSRKQTRNEFLFNFKAHKIASEELSCFYVTQKHSNGIDSKTGGKTTRQTAIFVFI